MAKIIIELNTDAGDTLDNVLDQFGFIRASASNYKNDLRGATALSVAEEIKKSFDRLAEGAKEYAAEMAETAEPDEVALRAAGQSFRDVPSIGGDLGPMDGDRKRGEAGPGHRRRTNAQIDDDKRYFDQKARAKAALAAMDRGVHPEERVNADPDDSHVAFTDPDDTAQDAADEARPQGPPTLEDLRAAIVRYTDKFGAAASVKNMRGILGCGVEQVKADDISGAIAKLEHLIADGAPQNENPGGRYVITGQTGVEAVDLGVLPDNPPVAPVTASKADFVEAFKAYARKYDGTDDASDNGKMVPITKEDIPKVFQATFGAGVTSLPSIPGGQTPEAFGKIVAAIKQATEQNSFKREAKS